MIDALARLTIKSRLALGFGVILALMVLLTTLGIQKVNFIDRTLAEMTDINAVKQRYAINYRGSVHDRAIAVRDIAIANTKEQIAAFEQEIRQLEAFYATSEKNMQEMQQAGVSFSSREQSILDEISRIQQRTLPLIQQIIQNKKAGIAVDRLVLEQARPAFISWLNTINEFIDYQEQQNQTATPEARGVAGGFQTLMLTLSAFAIAVSVLIALLIERSLRASLGGEPFSAQQAIRTMAGGDLTHAVRASHHGSVMDSLSDMSQKVTAIVRNIAQASNNVSGQVSEVADGSTQVLKVAQNQAALTNQTASKLDSMRGSIDQVANIARHTEENSGLTVEFAKQGREVVETVAQEMEKISRTVNDTVAQIKRLEDNTKKIGGIAGVISGISEQTNLLALNAAIEAARAGESGRGFAVVADEVRQLAKRTGEATSQIENMINEVQAQTAASVNAMETTQPQVENGKAQTRTATELLENIEQQATDSLARVKEVAQAAASQVSVVTEISQAMEQVAAMSDAAMQSMDNNDRATRRLSELAAELRQEVTFFRV